MDWTSIGATLARVGLPALGSAFGGPLGGTIGGALGNAVADALGVERTPQAVVAAVEADPETAKDRLKDIESARQADVDALRIEADSSASARAMQIAVLDKGSWTEWTPTILAFANTGALFLVIAALLWIATRQPPVELSPGIKELLFVVLGVLLAGFKDGQGFFFGTSRSSERNGAAIRAIAANSSTPSPAQIAGRVIQAATDKRT